MHRLFRHKAFLSCLISSAVSISLPAAANLVTYAEGTSDAISIEDTSVCNSEGDADFATIGELPILENFDVSYEVSQDGSSVTYYFSGEVEPESNFVGFDVIKRNEDGTKTVLDTSGWGSDSPNVFDESYVFTENGEYTAVIEALGYKLVVVSITIDEVSPRVDIDNPFVDTEAPVITLDVPDITGLSSGVPFQFKVYTDENCTIKIGTNVFSNETEATGEVYSNGKVTVVAVDAWGNKSTETVDVTAFGDGSLPSGGNGRENENPLVNNNKAKYWEQAAAGELSNGDVSGDKGSSNSKLDELPQTNKGKWLDLVVCASLVATAGLGIFVMRKYRVKKGR